MGLISLGGEGTSAIIGWRGLKIILLDGNNKKLNTYNKFIIHKKSSN
jgi:hypothetical protein